jgi:hypothetical protein
VAYYIKGFNRTFDDIIAINSKVVVIDYETGQNFPSASGVLVDSSGNWDIEVPANIAYQVRIFGVDYDLKVVDNVYPSTTRYKYVLTCKLGRIKITVKDTDGNPLSGIPVKCTDFDGAIPAKNTDSNGVVYFGIYEQVGGGYMSFSPATYHFLVNYYWSSSYSVWYNSNVEVSATVVANSTVSTTSSLSKVSQGSGTTQQATGIKLSIILLACCRGAVSAPRYIGFRVDNHLEFPKWWSGTTDGCWVDILQPCDGDDCHNRYSAGYYNFTVGDHYIEACVSNPSTEQIHIKIAVGGEIVAAGDVWSSSTGNPYARALDGRFRVNSDGTITIYTPLYYSWNPPPTPPPSQPTPSSGGTTSEKDTTTIDMTETMEEMKEIMKEMVNDMINFMMINVMISMISNMMVLVAR